MAATYKYDNYLSEMVRGLDELRKEGTSCDAVLQTNDGEKFQVHRNVLMAASPYFRAMFCSGFTEAKCDAEKPIALPSISSVGLRPLLDCLYSGKLVLTNDAVYDVLPTGHMMQLTEILGSCEEFLMKEMSETTCLRCLRFAEEYNLTELGKAAESFVLKHFTKLSASSEFKEITNIFPYLKSDKLKGKEIDIFRAVKQWIEARPERRKDIAEVMSLINFEAIQADALADEVMKYEPLKSDAESFKMVMDAMKYHSNLFSQPFNSPLKLRGEETFITISPFKRKDNELPPVGMTIYTKSDLQLESDEILKHKYERLKFNFESGSLNLVKVNEFLYLFGTECHSLTPTARRYDGCTKEWIDLTSPPRSGFVGGTAAYVPGLGSIVLVAGMLITESNDMYRTDVSNMTDSTLCYVIKGNTWKQKTSCPIRTVFHSSCSHQDLIYIAGGYRDTESQLDVSSKLYAYDARADIWLSKMNMNEARANAVFEALDDKLFLIGGGDFFNVPREAALSIEMYDILENQWTTVTERASTVSIFASSFVDGGKIIILGGYDVEIKRARNRISVFDTDSMDVITKGPRLRQALRKHVSAMLKIQNA